jgi:hypothetical protein
MNRGKRNRIAYYRRQKVDLPFEETFEKGDDSGELYSG